MRTGVGFLAQTLPHILVVDDQRNIRLMLETGLSVNGFRVNCARNGAEALAAVRSQPFDGVISDIYMPDVDGLQLVKELRLGWPSLPIILMTAQGSLELAVRAVEEGATDFIAKPFEVRAVAALVRRHLSAASEAATARTSNGLAIKSVEVRAVAALVRRHLSAASEASDNSDGGSTL